MAASGVFPRNAPGNGTHLARSSHGGCSHCPSMDERLAARGCSALELRWRADFPFAFGRGSPYLGPMPMEPPPDLASLSLTEIARLLAAKRLPPVEQWNPGHCGDSDMRIARDGTWFHQGSPIGREAMVRLFSTILRREPDGSYVLVTPVEKLSIEVEDAPFVAVEMKSEGEREARRLTFRLNTGDMVVAGAGHPLRLAAPPYPAGPAGPGAGPPRACSCT